MKRANSEQYAASVVGSEKVRAFIPAPLPPVPDLRITGPVGTCENRWCATPHQLDGTNRYPLRFAPGHMPPANAFWSLTMYECRLAAKDSVHSSPPSR